MVGEKTELVALGLELWKARLWRLSWVRTIWGLENSWPGRRAGVRGGEREPEARAKASTV